MYSAFITSDASLHTEKVVILRLLVIGIITFELEFDSLEIVARVELIRNSQRREIERLQIIDEIGFSGQSEHLDETLLSEVIRILSAAFALSNPSRNTLLGDSITDVATKLHKRLSHVARRKTTLNDKSAI